MKMKVVIVLACTIALCVAWLLVTYSIGAQTESNLGISGYETSTAAPGLVSVTVNATGKIAVEYTAYKDGSTEPAKKWAAAEIDPARQGIPDNIPMTDFAPGSYRLEIKLTDKGSNKTITENGYRTARADSTPQATLKGKHIRRFRSKWVPL